MLQGHETLPGGSFLSQMEATSCPVSQLGGIWKSTTGSPWWLTDTGGFSIAFELFAAQNEVSDTSPGWLPAGLRGGPSGRGPSGRAFIARTSAPPRSLTFPAAGLCYSDNQLAGKRVAVYLVILQLANQEHRLPHWIIRTT